MALTCPSPIRNFEAWPHHQGPRRRERKRLSSGDSLPFHLLSFPFSPLCPPPTPSPSGPLSPLAWEGVAWITSVVLHAEAQTKGFRSAARRGGDSLFALVLISGSILRARGQACRPFFPGPPSPSHQGPTPTRVHIHTRAYVDT